MTSMVMGLRTWWTEVFSKDPKLVDWKCPISDVVMDDPVKAMDGWLYERMNIQRHFINCEQAGKQILSPVTNKPMKKKLVPAADVKKAIMRFEEEQRARSAGQEPDQADDLVEWDKHGMQTARRSFRTSDSSLCVTVGVPIITSMMTSSTSTRGSVGECGFSTAAE